MEPDLDQPLAVVAVGPPGGARSAVLGALLGVAGAAPRVPRGGFLVINYGRAATGFAYLPGHPGPVDVGPIGADPVDVGPALARPPRRVELTLPDPLLRHFAVVDTPDTTQLGVAGVRLVLDAVDRGGAVLFVIAEEQAPSAVELDLLAEVSRGDATVFFVVTPSGDGGWGGSSDDTVELGPVSASQAASVAIEAHRATLLSVIPALADARWFALDPAEADTACLRRALIDWAGPEGLRRASASPPVLAGVTRTVPLAAGARQSGWADHLDRQSRAAAHRLRQNSALELANIHLRGVRSIVSGTGCPGLPEMLDRELHALSLRVVAECDEAVERIVDEVLTLVLGNAPDEVVRRRVVVALRWSIAEWHGARDLSRVLLVTGTAGIDIVAGPDAIAGLAAYSAGPDGAILPPVGVALAGDCYRQWCDPANADVARARSWLHRALGEVELELSREMAYRIRAVRLSLTTVLADSVDQGILLA